MAIRISLIGGSGSGKSSFFAGLTEALVVQPYRLGSGTDQVIIQFRIKSIKKSANYFNIFGGDAAESIFVAAQAAQELENYRIRTMFPMPTAAMDSVEFVFEFLINNRHCEDIIITDYAGELIDASNKAENAEALQSLCKSIAESDSLIMMGDTQAAAQWVSVPYQLSEAVRAPRMNMLIPIILNVAEKSGRKITTLLALTKSDHPNIPDGVRNQNFGQLSTHMVDNTYGAIFTQLDLLKWAYGVVPVSAVGMGCADELGNIQQNANIKQENIDIAVLFCLYNALLRSLDEKNAAIAPHEKMLGKIGLLNKAKKASYEKLRDERDSLQSCLDAMQGMMATFQQCINHLHMEAAQIQAAL